MSKSTEKNKNKAVVMILQSLPPHAAGGAEIQAIRLSRSLIGLGVKVLLLAPGIGNIKGTSVIDGVPVHRLHSPLNYVLDILFAIKEKRPPASQPIEFDDTRAQHDVIKQNIGFGARLRYLIFLINAFMFLRKRKNEFDIIHSHTIEWPAYVAAILSKRFRKSLLVKDSTMNGIFNILRYPSGKEKQQLIIQQARFVAMTNVIEKNLLMAGVSKERIYRIPNGISINDTIKTNYDSGVHVLFVGNLYQQPAKGVDILLKAWPRIAAEKPDAVLSIAGDGDLAAYGSYCSHLGIQKSVRILGKHPNVSALMLESDLFVLPSRREGMPNVLMEAMLKGLPCIATDISGSQDLINHGVNGVLIKPTDADALANAILHLLNSPADRARMGTEAAKTIRKNYSIDVVARRYAELYAHITNNLPHE